MTQSHAPKPTLSHSVQVLIALVGGLALFALFALAYVATTGSSSSKADHRAACVQAAVSGRPLAGCP